MNHIITLWNYLGLLICDICLKNKCFKSISKYLVKIWQYLTIILLYVYLLPMYTYLYQYTYLPLSTYHHLPTYVNLLSSAYLPLPIPICGSLQTREPLSVLFIFSISINISIYLLLYLSLYLSIYHCCILFQIWLKCTSLILTIVNNGSPCTLENSIV